MKAWSFDAVSYAGAVYCANEECCPISLNNEEVNPIFAHEEWDYYPTCDACGYEHDYITLFYTV